MKMTSRLTVFLRRQRKGIRFCARFALFTVLVFAGLYAAQNVLVVPLNHHFAWITAKLLRLVGGHASSSGPMVRLSRFAVEIRSNCNAVFEVGLYAAAVWAYPASWRDRLLGTLAGASVLYIINVLRILTLLTVGLLYPSWFEVIHVYAWQMLFLLLVTICWIEWVGRIRPVA